jgi:hypothetical protein
VYQAWGPAMATVSEYRQFAKECLRWADEAKAEQDRAAFLELARDWTMAALRLEGALTTNETASVWPAPPQESAQ